MFENFAKFFLENRKITLVIITTIAFFGALSYVLLPKQYNPSIVAPAFEIRVPVPGYSSEQASRFVARELENRLMEIPGIDKLYGYSQDEYCAITVSFKVGTNLESAKTRLYDKISSNSANRPYGVADISIRSIDPEELPQVAFAFTYDWTGLTQQESGIYLRNLAERTKEELKQVAGTSNLEVLGGYANSLNIRLIPDKLEKFWLDVATVTEMLRHEIGNRIGGTLELADKRVVISMDGQGDTEESLRSLPLQDKNGVKTYLGDVSEIQRGPTDPSSFYFYQQSGNADMPTVFLAVSKQKGSNAVKVVDGVLERMKEVKDRLPKNVTIRTIQDEWETAREATNELLFHLALSIGIVFVVLVVFLGFRNAANAAFCIPMVLWIVFVIAFIFGLDINRITLFALILSLGILVDDSIVVVENNARHLAARHDNGKSKKEALLSSVKEVGVSIVLSTITRILSFLGMFAVTGMMGDYMKPIPIFASIALTASLFVAFSINPFLADFLSRESRSKKAHSQKSHIQSDSKFIAWYSLLLAKFVGTGVAERKRRKFLKPAFWIALVLVIILPISLDLFRARMLPKADKDQVYLWIDLPRSATVEQTRAIAKQASDLMLGKNIPLDLQLAESVSASVGDRFLPDFPNLFRGSQDRSAPNQASIRINLKRSSDRDISSERYVIEIRPILRQALLRSYPDATIRLLEDPPGPPTIATFHVKIKWPQDGSLDSLTRFSEAIEGTVRKIANEESLEDLADTVSRPMETNRIVLDKDRMLERGIDRQTAQNVLQNAFSDQTIGMVRTNDNVLEPENIIVSPSKSDRTDQYLKTITVPNRNGERVKLDEIADYKPGWMGREIYTENRSTTLHLYAEMGWNSVVYPILRLYREFSSPEFERTGYRKVSSDPYGIRFVSNDGSEFRIEWGGEWELTMDTFRDMGTAMILSLLAIYFLVVAEFKSFRTGGIVMMTFLFSFFWIFPGFALLHLISGIYFTATAMIGAIALGGIVVGNAIILLDYIEQLYQSGNSLEQSILEGARKRFVPVLLTSAAAVLGSLIIASDPVWSGLAWSIVFGLSASGILTLFFVPIFFYDLQLRKNVAHPVR